MICKFSVSTAATEVPLRTVAAHTELCNCNFMNESFLGQSLLKKQFFLEICKGFTFSRHALEITKIILTPTRFNILSRLIRGTIREVTNMFTCYKVT